MASMTFSLCVCLLIGCGGRGSTQDTQDAMRWTFSGDIGMGSTSASGTCVWAFKTQSLSFEDGCCCRRCLISLSSCAISSSMIIRRCGGNCENGFLVEVAAGHTWLAGATNTCLRRSAGFRSNLPCWRSLSVTNSSNEGGCTEAVEAHHSMFHSMLRLTRWLRDLWQQVPQSFSVHWQPARGVDRRTIEGGIKEWVGSNST